MSEIGELWREIRDDARKHKSKNRGNFSDVLNQLRLNHTIKEMNPGMQYRVDSAIDLYPSNKKYHILKTGQRGRFSFYPEKLESFIEANS